MHSRTLKLLELICDEYFTWSSHFTFLVELYKVCKPLTLVQLRLSTYAMLSKCVFLLSLVLSLASVRRFENARGQDYVMIGTSEEKSKNELSTMPSDKYVTFKKNYPASGGPNQFNDFFVNGYFGDNSPSPFGNHAPSLGPGAITILERFLFITILFVLMTIFEKAKSLSKLRGIYGRNWAKMSN